MHGRRECGHLQNAAGQGFRLPPLLRAESWIGARRVDEGDDRSAELGSQLHEAERLAVSLRVRHAEIALEILLGVPPLLVPDHHHRDAGQPGPAPDDRRIVAVQPVSVKLDEVGKDGAQVIERVWPACMTRHLHPLHWGQVHVDLGSEGIEPDLEETGFFRNVDLLLLAQLGEILDLPLQFLQGPLKIETVGVRHFVSKRGAPSPKP